MARTMGEKSRQKHGDGEPEMGAVDDAEDDDAPHFHFLKKAGIEAADSGKTRAVLAECWRALSVNVSDGNNKKKPRTTEFIHHNTSTKGTLLEHNREEDGMTDDDIKELCKACSNLLHTLDATHSRFLKWHMKWDDEAKKAVRELEALIASALKQARAIGVSMTPKWHLLDDAEDDDAPHFHFLKKAGIEAADSGKTRAVLAECWSALSVNVSDGNNKKKPRTTEFIHHNTSTKGTLLEHNREEDGMTDDDIKVLCKACSNLLHTLDATHSRFLKWHMKWDDEAKKAVRELEALIASALKQARAIGVSMTPKWHLLEDHILDQHIWLVKNGWGGMSIGSTNRL